MAAPKGNKQSKGRPKGSTNKIQTRILDDVLDVYDRLGGADGLLAWVKTSQRNLSAFYGWLMSKRLPSMQDVKVGNLDEDGFKVVVEKVVTDKRPSEGADD